MRVLAIGAMATHVASAQAVGTLGRGLNETLLRSFERGSESPILGYTDARRQPAGESLIAV